MTVRNFIPLFLFAVLNLTNSYGQLKQDKQLILSQARQIFLQINDYKNYHVVTINSAEGFLGHATDNGGSLTGYFKADSLKKIVDWVGLSNRVLKREYYFDKGKLVFVYYTESRYKADDQTGEINYSELNVIFRGQYYFSGDKLLECTLSDEKHKRTKAEDAADLISLSKQYEDFFYKKHR